MKDHERLQRELEPLSEARLERGQHFESLRHELLRQSAPKPARTRILLGAIFVVGIASGFAANQVLSQWTVSWKGEGTGSNFVLTPVDGKSGPPLGVMRSDSGECYRIEVVDGKLVMSEVIED
ncbi:MAG: hypothetical protein ACI9F9_002416 [Candidatus Paceibacteria bacterium]|jgi:hypothetical protein